MKKKIKRKTIKTTVVGSKEDPITIYWDIQKTRTDDFLMVLSLTSGAYGPDIIDEDQFKINSKAFVRYAKKRENYYTQIKYVLENSTLECAEFLANLLLEKWKLKISYKNASSIAIA